MSSQRTKRNTHSWRQQAATSTKVKSKLQWRSSARERSRLNHRGSTKHYLPASIDRIITHSIDTNSISEYPSTAIFTFKFFPEHLSPVSREYATRRATELGRLGKSCRDFLIFIQASESYSVYLLDSEAARTHLNFHIIENTFIKEILLKRIDPLRGTSQGDSMRSLFDDYSRAKTVASIASVRIFSNSSGKWC